MGTLLELLRDIMEFATDLSADNITTWILDDSKVKKEHAETGL